MICPHRRRVFVPTEDDPSLMLDVCLDCETILELVDDDMTEFGEDLGDPEENDW